MKQTYDIPSFKVAEVGLCKTILSGSIFSESTICATGQKIGADYSFDTGAGAEAGKSFNHEWN